MTKRDVVRVASAAVRKASAKAMQTAGYVIKAENGWVVRENEDGTVLKTEEILAFSKVRSLNLY